MRTLNVTRLGGPISYAEGLNRQRAIGEALVESREPQAELLLLEHEPVYTLGRATKTEHLLGTPEDLAARSGAKVLEVERGGSVTYHGPGQLTAYLLLNLKAWDIAIHQHLWNLEEAAVRTLEAFGIQGQRIEGMTGVWTGHEGAQSKVCAIGVGCRRWVTYHGLGLNVDLELTPFELIDPCGLGRRPVTSLARLLGREVTLQEVSDSLIRSLAQLLEAAVGQDS